MNCYVCDRGLIGENVSQEHIILNAAGGRLRSKDLLCKTCNSEFGEGIDGALAKQLNHMANMLMIERHHGEPQPIMGRTQSSGTEYKLEVGGQPSLTKPTFNRSKEGDKTMFSVKARTEEELRSMLKGIARKHATFDVNEAIEQAKWITKKIDEPVSVSVEVGGEQEFRSVCKCATNFFIYKGGDVLSIKHLIPYIKGDVKKNIVWMHYQNGLYDLEANESFHVIHLVGNKTEHILYCYVDYFNTYKFLVLLNDNYNGEDVEFSYCYDVLERKEVNRKINLQYDRISLINFFRNRDTDPIKKVTDAFDHTLKIGFRRQREFQREQLFSIAIKKALEKHTHGNVLSEDELEKVINEIVGSVLPTFLPNEISKNNDENE